ncbi:MAG TPA: alcohol dehydrogenase catalytic domain-containing protein [Vicinamibacterales bacterium]|nr:alcohol dehydrogenase catalytic domain-containing protein [Vicinamibacterales bacterium]
MRTLIIDGPGRLGIAEVAPPISPSECRIRVSMAGICGTDLQLLEGYAGFRGTPGHEFVGVVERAPQADQRWIGKRVVGEINVGCGACEWCTAGVKEHCPSRTVLGIRQRDGAFADLLCLPAANLHEVPEAIDDQTAVFVEPVAAACRILEQVEITRTTRAAVLGDGRMGLIAAQVLRTATDDVVLRGRHEHKLRIGAQIGLAVARADAPDRGRGCFDVVVEVTGRPGGLEHALALVRPRGTVVMKSTFHGPAPFSPWPVVVHEVTLVGSRCGPFERAIDLLASGQVQVRPIISRVAPLEEFASALDEARTSLKVLMAVAREG